MMKILSITCLLSSVFIFVSGQTVNPDPNCTCITYYNCLKNFTQNIYGINLIDIRLGEERQCENIMDVCCSKPDVKPSTSQPPKAKKHVDKGCGHRNRNGIDFKITGDYKALANDGEFPWMTLILRKDPADKKQLDVFACGGSLINKQVVLTAAHCVENFKASELTIRAGEWDTNSDKERLRHQNRKASTIVVHPKYDGSYLGYDFALIILSQPFDLADNVEVVCLPEKDEIFKSNDCWVTGWGKVEYGPKGAYSSILKAVQLPTVPTNECQQRFRKTRLSEIFKLHSSFICAGGVEGRDACQGDGGGPLVCPWKHDPNRYIQAGVVSWGIGCNDNVPAAYANVALARPWIDETLSKIKINSLSYTPKRS